MIEIIPAIMPRSFEDLQEKMVAVKGLVPLVQIDVMDSTLTIDPTWPYLDKKTDPAFLHMVAQTHGMPFWEDLDFEVDLLVRNPGRIVSDWVTLGAKRVIFHIESDDQLLDLVKNFPNQPKESEFHIEVGLSINSRTPQDAIRPFLDHVDFIQCMGIDNIGNQGEPFDSNVISTITFLRDLYPKLIISVDGGVRIETAQLLAKAGVNRLVSGSAIYQHPNPHQAVLDLRKAGEGMLK